MPRTLDQINADILAVRTEISDPVEEIHYADRTVRKRSTDLALKALAALETELVTATALANAGIAGNTTRVRQIRLYSNGGFSNGCGWY